MYRISGSNEALLGNVRGSASAYQEFRSAVLSHQSRNASGASLDGLAMSPKEAMDMESPVVESALPITITITLTTTLWPRTAH